MLYATIFALLVASFVPGEDDDDDKKTRRASGTAIVNPAGIRDNAFLKVRAGTSHFDFDSFFDGDGEKQDFFGDQSEWGQRISLKGSYHFRPAVIAGIRGQGHIGVSATYKFVSFDTGDDFDNPSSSGFQNITWSVGARGALSDRFSLGSTWRFHLDIGSEAEEPDELNTSDLQNAVYGDIDARFLLNDRLSFRANSSCTYRLDATQGEGPSEFDFNNGNLFQAGIQGQYNWNFSDNVRGGFWTGFYFNRRGEQSFNGEDFEDTDGHLITLGVGASVDFVNSGTRITLGGARNEYGQQYGQFSLAGENYDIPSKDFGITISKRYDIR